MKIAVSISHELVSIHLVKTILTFEGSIFPSTLIEIRWRQEVLSKRDCACGGGLILQTYLDCIGGVVLN